MSVLVESRVLPCFLEHDGDAGGLNQHSSKKWVPTQIDTDDRAGDLVFRGGPSDLEDTATRL